MKKFFTTYTIAFIFLSLLLTAFFFLDADFTSHRPLCMTDHPLHLVWSKYINWVYAPFSIGFVLPSLIVLLSYGMGLLISWKNRISSITLKSFFIDLCIITGSIAFGVGVNFVSLSDYFLNETLPFLYWIFIGFSSFILGLLIIGWKNNYSHFKARSQEEPRFRTNQLFTYALFNSSLEVSIIWLILGIISTPMAEMYYEIVENSAILFLFYSLVVWPLALLIYIRDRFVRSRILRLLLTSLATLGVTVATLGIGSIIYYNFHSTSDYTKTIEEYDADIERWEEERRAEEAERLARIEAARPYTGKISEVTFVDEEYYPVIHEFSFDFLWDDPKADLDSVTSAMSYVRKEISGFILPIYLSSSDVLYYPAPNGIKFNDDDLVHYKEKGKGAVSFAMLCSYLTYIFPAKNMADIAFKYIDYLPTFLPESSFRDSSFEECLILYMLVYEDLYNSRDNFEAFQRVYDVMNIDKDYRVANKYELYYDEFAHYVHAEDYTPFYWGDSFRKSKATEVYSFWARRYKEGTHQDLYYILKSIYQLYNE